MSIEGLWTGEIHGPFGWEPSGIFLFENGRVIGGDDRQYTLGSYSLSRAKLTAELQTRYYGQPRTIFGATRSAFSATLVGALDGDQILGEISPPGLPRYDLRIRLARREELAACAGPRPDRVRLGGAQWAGREAPEARGGAIIAFAPES